MTNKRIKSGEILSPHCFPIIFGYDTALECKLFCDHDAAILDVGEKNVAGHRRGLELIKPGAKCSEIASG